MRACVIKRVQPILYGPPCNSAINFNLAVNIFFVLHFFFTQVTKLQTNIDYIKQSRPDVA